MSSFRVTSQHPRHIHPDFPSTASVTATTTTTTTAAAVWLFGVQVLCAYIVVLVFGIYVLSFSGFLTTSPGPGPCYSCHCPVSCHFRDGNVLPDTSLSCRKRYIKGQTFTLSFLLSLRKILVLVLGTQALVLVFVLALAWSLRQSSWHVSPR